MRCVNCDSEIRNGSKYCAICGADQTKQADHTSAARSAKPLVQFPTNRSLKKVILLNLITFGIYEIVLRNRMTAELNRIASAADGEHTISVLLNIILGPISLGIFPYVWYHQYSNRIGAELKRRGCEASFGASDFWRWVVLGSLILIGPYVYMHRELKAMNQLNEHYNLHGSYLIEG